MHEITYGYFACSYVMNKDVHVYGLFFPECGCDLIGSHNTSCDQLTGQCDCKDNVEGVQCNSCALNHHQLSSDGCTGEVQSYLLFVHLIRQLQILFSQWPLLTLIISARFLFRGKIIVPHGCVMKRCANVVIAVSIKTFSTIELT